MSDPTGATPPRDPEPNEEQPGGAIPVPEQPGTGDAQPAGSPAEPVGQPPADPYGQPPVAPPPAPYGQQPGDAQAGPAGQPPVDPYGPPPGGVPGYGQPGATPGYGSEQPGAAPGYGQPGGAPSYGQPGVPPGYGQPGGTPYPPAGYGQPVPPSAGTTIGDGFGWAWKKFTQNAGALIGGYAVYAAVLIVVVVIFFAIFIGGAAASTDAYGNLRPGAATVGIFGYAGFIAVLLLFSYLMQAGITRAAVEVMRTGRTQFGTFFQFERLGTVIGAALLVGLATGIGTMLCYLPGLAVALFAQFTLFYVIDKGLGAIDAIKASCQLVYRNFGVSILLYLAVLVANGVGSAVCGIGILVSVPVALLLTGYVFRRLHNEAVAA